MKRVDEEANSVKQGLTRQAEVRSVLTWDTLAARTPTPNVRREPKHQSCVTRGANQSAGRKQPNTLRFSESLNRG